jgi:hypothetical protein
MRQMRPSWTFALVRKKFGCHSFINADELQLTAICGFASTARALLTGDLAMYGMADELSAVNLRPASFDWLYFKGKTMQIINARLTDPHDAISDHTIGAICELIMSEVRIHCLTGGLTPDSCFRPSSSIVPYHE